MNVKEVDLIQLSQIISEIRDNSICLECCKWYTTPKTATCGHSLCQSCWMGRRACPTCAKPVEMRHLRQNEPLDIQTKHITEMTAEVEKILKINLDEFLMSPSDSLVDPNINVNEWLASFQNNFSASPQSSDQSSPDIQCIANPIEVSSNQVQIHTNSGRTTKSPEKVLREPIPQDDWDKIEVMASEDFEVPFYKKAPLLKNNMEQGCSNETTTVKKSTHHFNCNMPANDDINITIKVCNSVISNITIKKNNDVAVKNMRDGEAQTSLCLRELDVNKSRESVQQLDAQRIVINVNNEISITVNQNVPQTEQGASNLIASSNHQPAKTKQNTDSAETATAQFEITESVEKELSKIMEDIEIEEMNNSISNDDQKAHKSRDVPLKSASHQNVNTATLTNNNVEIDHESLEKQTPAITIREAETSQHMIMSAVYEIDCSLVLNEGADKKGSENVFSSCGDQNVDNEQFLINSKITPNKSQTNVDEFLTPVGHNEGNMVMEEDIVSDDSDKSEVEETPQKVSSFTKVKSKSNAKGTEARSSQKLQSERKTSNKSSLSNMPTVIDLTDTPKRSSNDVPAICVETVRHIETPYNINKFVDQITHQSTPFTRKCLSFNTTGDIDQTLSSTNEVAKTTQENEFLRKSFETTVSEKSISATNNRVDKFCIAGTLLKSTELNKVKLLCVRNNWTYTDQYSPELTHLVVAVDNENRAERSVKFICALASSKWIVSLEWVQECLRTNTVVEEEPYEVLDQSGEPGPRRSRTAPKSLFDGISFYCMEPFSILSADLLTELLEAAGGRVVRHRADIAVSERTTRPALLLAEPEHTQDMYTFVDLALKQSVVPVNYEWVLNCIGVYSVLSLRGQLLCPAAALHRATDKWPAHLMAHGEHSQYT